MTRDLHDRHDPHDLHDARDARAPGRRTDPTSLGLVERLGTLALGLLAGMALGLGGGLVALWAGAHASLAAWVLAGGGLGALIGLVGGLEAGFGLAEAALHMIAGFVAIDAWRSGGWRGSPSESLDDGRSPAWKGVLLACAVAGVVVVRDGPSALPAGPVGTRTRTLKPTRTLNTRPAGKPSGSLHNGPAMSTNPFKPPESQTGDHSPPGSPLRAMSACC